MRMDVKRSLLFLLFLHFNDVLHGQNKRFLDECSAYYFHGDAQHKSWNLANTSCGKNQSVLASIESNEEWEYLKNITISKKHRRWYIGLKYNLSSKKWCWLSSSDACLNETLSRPGEWRWHKHEPNNLHTEHCVEMYSNGQFNNIVCDDKTRQDNRRYICEKKVDCVNSSVRKTTVEPFSTKNTPTYGGAKTSATTAEISTTADTIKQTSKHITSTKPNIYSAPGSGKQKTIMISSIQEATLPVSHPTDDSNSGNQSSSITVIVVAVLAVLLVILLVVLGAVLWRRRSSSSKEREDQMDRHVVDGIRLESVPEQTPQDQAQPRQNDAPLLEDKNEDPHLYAVVKKKTSKAAHRSSGMSTSQHPVVPDDYEQGCVTSNPPSEPSLERKVHIYANANQTDPKHKPPVYPTPYSVTQKRPTEHADDKNGKEQHLYAAVDKTRKRDRKSVPSTCGPVYAELGFNPSQDEDENKVTTQDSFTVYASIQEGQ